MTVIWPSHYREFVEQHALSGAQADVPEESDLSTVGATVGLYDESWAFDEADNFNPGLVVKANGFVPIGQVMTGTKSPE